MRRTITTALAAFLVLGALAACGTNRPVDEQLNDAAIVAAINARLAESSETSMLNINVDSVDRVVTLNGTVRSDQSRLEAERIARTTSGVDRVISRLRVQP
jgi:osmotically-inducible protein OsmY